MNVIVVSIPGEALCEFKRIDIFWSETGSGLENWATHPLQEYPAAP